MCHLFIRQAVTTTISTADRNATTTTIRLVRARYRQLPFSNSGCSMTPPRRTLAQSTVVSSSAFISSDACFEKVIVPAVRISRISRWAVCGSSGSSKQSPSLLDYRQYLTFCQPPTAVESARSRNFRPICEGSRIDGAVVEVLDGYLRGHRVTSGMDPVPPPGFHPPPLTTGGYRLPGVPPGTHHLRVSKNGYLPQQIEVIVEGLGSVNVDVALQRQP